MFWTGDVQQNSLIVAGPTVQYLDTFWDDLRVGAGEFNPVGAGNDPDEIAFLGALSIYEYNIADESAFFTQIPHNYKLSTDLKLHLHWTPHSRGVIENGHSVNWRIDLSVVIPGGTFIGPTTYILTDTCDGVDNKHQLVAATVDVPGLLLTDVSAMIVGRLYRLAGDTWATNTVNNRPAVLEIDFHYQVDSPGSRSEYVK